MPCVAVVGFFQRGLFGQQAVAQCIGLPLQRGAVRGLGQGGDALVDGLRGPAAELHMALLVLVQGPGIACKPGLLCIGGGAQHGHLDVGGQPCADAGDAAVPGRITVPPKAPMHIPLRMAMKTLPALADGGSGIERLAQCLARLDVYRVRLLGVFFRDLCGGDAARQEQCSP